MGKKSVSASVPDLSVYNNVSNQSIMEAALAAPKGKVSMDTISAKFQTQLELHVGKMNVVGAKIAEDDTTTIADWLVFKGFGPKETRQLHIVETYKGDFSRTKENAIKVMSSFLNALNTWTHLANGTFDSWKAGEHWPISQFTVEDDDLGSVAGQDVQGKKQHLIFDPKQGQWLVDEPKMVDGKKVLPLAAPQQQTYHTMVDWFFLGDSVAIWIPLNKGNGYIRAVIENLKLGVGKVEPAVAEAKAAAAIRNEEFWSAVDAENAGLSDHLPEDKRLAPQVPELWIRIEGEKALLDLYKVEIGTPFTPILDGGTAWTDPIIWDPSNEAHMVQFERMARKPEYWCARRAS